MKVDLDEDAIRDLEEAEYEDGGSFEKYEGEQPPVGTELFGYIKKIWWTYSQHDDDMLKILWVADGNEGDEEEFNGCPIWENYALISTMKFKWGPFLDVIGLSIRDVIKKTHVEEEEDGNNGQPIIKIGTWEPGSDESYCRVITDRHKFGDNWQTDVGTWLPYEDEEESEPEPEPDPPARSRSSRSSAAGAGSARRSGGRTRREAETADETDAGDDEGGGEGSEEASETATPARGRARGGRASRAPGGARAAKPAATRRGGRRGAAADDSGEPPF